MLCNFLFISGGHCHFSPINYYFLFRVRVEKLLLHSQCVSRPPLALLWRKCFKTNMKRVKIINKKKTKNTQIHEKGEIKIIFSDKSFVYFYLSQIDIYIFGYTQLNVLHNYITHKKRESTNLTLLHLQYFTQFLEYHIKFNI